MQFEKFHRLCNGQEPIRKKPRPHFRICCVSTCNSDDDETLIYHQFPRSGNKVVVEKPDGGRIVCDLRKIWEDKVGVDQKITKYSKVCSLHFTGEDYCTKRHKRLKPLAVPNLNLPEESGFSTFKNKFKLLCHVRDINKYVLKENANAINIDNNNLQPMTKQLDQNNESCAINVETAKETASIIIDSSSDDEKDILKEITTFDTEIICSSPSIVDLMSDSDSVEVIEDGSDENRNVPETDSNRQKVDTLDTLWMHTSFELERLSNSSYLHLTSVI